MRKAAAPSPRGHGERQIERGCDNAVVETPQRDIGCVRILGAVQAETNDGTFVDLPSASQRRLLAILALHAPRRLRAEWLAEVLDVSPAALRTTVSRVRAQLGTSVVETTATGYELLGEVDAARFCDAVAAAASAPDGKRVDALQRALGHWNGPALDEFASEPWAEGESARLTEIHAATVDDLAGALIEARRSAEAVALLDEHIARYPFRDASWGLLVRALAGSGRQAEALRAFQRYRDLLAEELGTEPSAAVARIERRVATGWDGVESAVASNAAPGADATSLQFPRALVTPTGFVGRARELRVLADELHVATSTGLRYVLLSGEAGIGKTTFLAACADALTANDNASVVYARCDQDEVSLQPFRRALATCVGAAPLALLTDHVAACGGELLRLCPTLGTRIATVPAPTTSDDATERFLMFDAATDLLRRVAELRPLVLMLDDLQFAEPTALTMLRHLVDTLASAPILLVLTARDLGDAASEAARLVLADLARGEPRRLELSGFNDQELEALLGDTPISQSPRGVDRVEQLRELTAGNPLLAAHLIGHWAEHDDDDAVPANLRDIVWSRVHSLDGPATDVLTAASVLGIDFADAALARMVELDDSIVVDVLDAAARRGLLIDTGQRSWRFAHALVANALYTDLGPAERARLHERAVRALESEAESARVVVQLARHCARAGLSADALRWTLRAGDDALAGLAPVEAAQHYRDAADLAVELERPGAERADILVRLGDAQHRAGDSDALATLTEGARLALQFGAREPLVRAALAGDRGFMRIDSGAPEYLEIVEAAVAATDPGDIGTYAPLRALLARSLMYTPDSARRLAAAHEALDLARHADDPTLLAQVAPAALYALWEPGRRELRVRIASEAVRAAERTADPLLIFGAHQAAAYNIAVESADPVLAARSISRMRAIVRACAEPRLRYTLGLYETFEATMAGRLDEGESIATANLDLGLRIGVPDAFTLFAAQLFALGSFAGRHQELLPLIEEAAHNSPGFTPFRLAYGIICAATGHEDRALDILSEATSTRFSEIQHDNLWTTTVIGYAVLAIELDDARAAAELLPLIEPFSSEVAFNGMTSQGPIAAYAGKLASLLGRHDEAEDYLVAALDIATAFGWNYHRATTLFALAQARFRRDGALDNQAHDWLCEAAELSRAGGFDSWLQRIEALAALNPR